MKKLIVALRLMLSLVLIENSVQQQQKLEWFWDRNHYVPEYGFDPQRQEQRTLLVVQDAAYGAEQQVIEVTQRVNRAYAKRWGYDVSTTYVHTYAFASQNTCFTIILFCYIFF